MSAVDPIIVLDASELTASPTLDSPLMGAFEVAYIATYPPAGFDPVSYKAGSSLTTSHSYMFHPLTIITSFIGLPNRDLDNNGKQSFYNIVKNFIGWEDNRSKRRKTFNIVKMPVLIIWHVVIGLIQFTTNIIKFLTEFLPLTVAGYARTLAYKIGSQVFSEQHDNAVRIALAAAFLGVTALYLVSESLYIVGRAVTSPHKSVRAGWRTGLELVSSPWLGRLLGSVLAIISIAMTVLIYALALPIAGKYVVAIALPHLPAAGLVVLNHFGQIALPILNAAAKTVFMPIVQPIFHVIGVTVSPAFVSLSALALMTITTIGTATSKLVYNIKNKWFKSREPQPHISREDLAGPSSTTTMAQTLASVPRRQVIVVVPKQSPLRDPRTYFESGNNNPQTLYANKSREHLVLPATKCSVRSPTP